MIKKKWALTSVIMVTFLTGFIFGLTGCGNSTKTIKKDDLTVEYTTEAKKSVQLPADYPKDCFPIYQDAFVMAVQNMNNSYVLTCFCKDPVKKVGAFYQELFKDSQVISRTEKSDEYTIFGVKDGYTYTVCVITNTEQEGELKDYPTSLAISVVPAPDDMAKGLEEMSKNLVNPAE